MPSTAMSTGPVELRPIHAIARFMPAVVTGKASQQARAPVVVLMMV